MFCLDQVEFVIVYSLLLIVTRCRCITAEQFVAAAARSETCLCLRQLSAPGVDSLVLLLPEHPATDNVMIWHSCGPVGATAECLIPLGEARSPRYTGP